jgi:hypothetical protein
MVAQYEGAIPAVQARLITAEINSDHVALNHERKIEV